MTKATPAPTKIVTFYSYKGGTGRSMALANIAWLLAAAGHRVLALDWDFEAPGLHRYFHPFLDDPELAESRGLLDFFWEFAEAARVQAKLASAGQASSGADWFLPFTDLSRFVVSLNYDFAKKKMPSREKPTLDFVGAGRQGPAYALRASTFGWNDFYDKLGGGVFLEHLQRRLRADYDFILIDSRTGLSDTAGICTVQMPDEVMTFFTLNRQSIRGVASVATSIRDQRRLPDGSHGVKIWPIPTRMENHEKERRDAALRTAESAFSDLLWHLTREQRVEHWKTRRIPHIGFYSYEEVLAAFADRTAESDSMLLAMETVAGCLVGKPKLKLARTTVTEAQRQRWLRAFGVGANTGKPVRGGAAATANARASVYLSYSRTDLPLLEARRLISHLQEELGVEVLWDDALPLGVPIDEHLKTWLQQANLVINFVGPASIESPNVRRETVRATRARRTIIPVLSSDELGWSQVPKELAELAGVAFSKKNFPQSLDELTDKLRGTLDRQSRQAISTQDPDDVQKGKWGGKAKAAGRELTAKITEVRKHWFHVMLTVRRQSGEPLKGKVRFHLHESFSPQVEEAPVRAGKATLILHSYGAFTVGAEADDGQTILELDLATVAGAPKLFRES